MDIKSISEANSEARKLGEINIHEFILKNPNNWPKPFLSQVIDQYQFIEKLHKKIPSWANNDFILGADILNIEQSSSEQTAKAKFQNLKGKKALDLTGGFGIDSYFLAQKFEHVGYCEPNRNLFEIVKHNFERLGISNVSFTNQKAEKFISSYKEKADLIFLDPDRRNEGNKKLVLIEECQPNLLKLQDQLLTISRQVLIKYSPMLDISKAINQLKNVFEILIIAIKNEVKELLFLLSAENTAENPEIKTINYLADGSQVFNFNLASEKAATIPFSDPLKYLYEPNSAILKAGAFKSVGQAFQLAKLANHSHFYTSNQMKINFPGRIFELNDCLAANSKKMRNFKKQAFNIIARNYPLKPETLKQKYSLKDGGDRYLIFTQNQNNEKIAMLCNRTN